MMNKKLLQTTPEYLLGAEPELVREYNDSWADMDVGIDYGLANVADWSY